MPLVVVDEPRLRGARLRRRSRTASARGWPPSTCSGSATGASRSRRPSAPRERAGTGYRDALAAAGAEWVATARVAFDGPDRPTAVIAATDRLALAVVDAALEAGLRVPEDLSVVGFDDIPAAASSRLTTVRQPLYEKGEAAGRLLTEGAAGREIILPVELVVRGSTATPA